MLPRARELLRDRAAAGAPLGVVLVGAGKFATMLLAQARLVEGLRVLAVADRDPSRTVAALDSAGFHSEERPLVTDAPAEALATPGAEIAVEATGDAVAGIEHAVLAIDRGLDVVMVNVEADALAGPALAARADAAGVVYSLAYGDQPALVCELVDWARACGFEVVAAGKGTKFLPLYRRVTPDGVWEHYGLSPAEAASGGLNAQMFTSFLDGTKSAIEMAAVANATGLAVPAGGLRFPPAGTGELASVCIPESDGGVLEGPGTVEVVSSVTRDGTPVRDDLRWGVYVTFAAPSSYVARCFAEYGVPTDRSGRYAALWRPNHLIGLEATVSILAAGLLGEATGTPQAWVGDVAAVAKRDLAPGDELDGEGGYTVYGALVPAARAAAEDLLPVGFARGIRLRRAVEAGQALCQADVEPLPDTTALALRRELLGPPVERGAV